MKNDFKDEVDLMINNDIAKNADHIRKNNVTISGGKDLIHDLRKIYDKMDKIYRDMGMNYCGVNPAFIFKNQLPMVEDLARMGYNMEIKYWESKGLKPRKGWHEFGTSTSIFTAKEVQDILAKDKHSESQSSSVKKRIKRVKL